MFNLMGVPAVDREHLVELFELFMHVEEGVDYEVAAAKRATAVEELAAYFGELAAWKLEHLADDVVSHVIQSSYVDEEGNEQVLRDAELTGFLLFLTSGGVETTSRLLSSTLVALQRHPVQWRKLCDDPSKVAAALEEGGRFESPVQYLGRRCMSETTVQGVTIPSGANILLLIGAANRDPGAFSNPDEFDIDRDLTTKVPLTFSFGPHICLGMHLARREAQLGLGAVLQRWPDLEVIEDGLVRAKDIHLMGWSSLPVSVSA
jgi:cytochrome P450